MQADLAELAGTKPKHLLPTFLVFNLFALEALHIAECLCVPCLAVSPCLVPYTFPSSFPKRLKKACPGLYTRLQSHSDGELPHLFLLLLCVHLCFTLLGSLCCYLLEAQSALSVRPLTVLAADARSCSMQLPALHIVVFCIHCMLHTLIWVLAADSDFLDTVLNTVCKRQG